MPLASSTPGPELRRVDLEQPHPATVAQRQRVAVVDGRDRADIERGGGSRMRSEHARRRDETADDEQPKGVPHHLHHHERRFQRAIRPRSSPASSGTVTRLGQPEVSCPSRGVDRRFSAHGPRRGHDAHQGLRQKPSDPVGFREQPAHPDAPLPPTRDSASAAAFAVDDNRVARSSTRAAANARRQLDDASERTAERLVDV